MTSSVNSVVVRPAQPSDAEGIVKVHFAAVHETAAVCYSEEIIRNWSGPITVQRIERMRHKIQQANGELLLVAQQGEEVVGFGSIVPERNELRAVYIHPSVGRKGVGTQIFKALEEMAISQGLNHLQTSASINAEAFYSKNGFEVIERGSFRLSSGHEMACIKMEKALTQRQSV